jgi:hypothetical protein
MELFNLLARVINVRHFERTLGYRYWAKLLDSL